jgi:hypothetical protein
MILSLHAHNATFFAMCNLKNGIISFKHHFNFSHTWIYKANSTNVHVQCTMYNVQNVRKTKMERKPPLYAFGEKYNKKTKNTIFPVRDSNPGLSLERAIS